MSKPFKGTKGQIGMAEDWWATLPLGDQQKWKKHYEDVRAGNPLRVIPFPDMVDTTSTRISKLTGHQIHCIWRFATVENRWKL